MSLQNLLNSFSGLSPNERLLIERAYRKAEIAHAGQFRKSGEPYVTHCVAVAQILADMKLDAEAIAAALLHDVLEDNHDVTLDELREEFNDSIAAMVDAVTKLTKLSSQAEVDRRERHSDRKLESIRKMLLMMNSDVRIALVKLADRLHNMRTLSHMAPDRQRDIAQETMDIYAPLANRLGIWQIKWELEDLAFRYLDQPTYREISAKIDERHPDRQAYMDRIIGKLRDELKRNGIENPIISGRPKHIYSIYSKMQRKQLPFDQIYDVRAVRVIVETRAQCYEALGVVHGLWRPVFSEFNDYIAAPKDNFYQSLHTTVQDDKGKTIEVQIRTAEMHEAAEYGIAAHWRYKEGRKRGRDKEFERRVMYLRRLMDVGTEVSDSAEAFVDAIKAEVFQDRVYVSTPKGDMVDLPAGSTPIDFAYHIHTDIGHRCRGAKIHGRLVSLNYQLKAGDQVEIITSKRGGPSLDWLNPSLGYTNTARARSKIRYYFRKLNRSKHISSGREALERELKRLGLLDSITFEAVSTLFSYDRVEDFLAAVGAGDINSSQIANRLLELERKQQAPSEEAQFRPVPTPLSVSTDNGVNITGTGGLLVNLARCCNPVPGNRIVGYITRGRGVTVHRWNCPNLQATEEPERLIEVTWGHVTAEQRYPVPIEIIAYDREGLLRDISIVIANEKVSMAAVNVFTQQSIATFHLTIEIGSAGQLVKILTQLEGVNSVFEVRRRHTA